MPGDKAVPVRGRDGWVLGECAKKEGTIFPKFILQRYFILSRERPGQFGPVLLCTRGRGLCASRRPRLPPAVAQREDTRIRVLGGGEGCLSARLL